MNPFCYLSERNCNIHKEGSLSNKKENGASVNISNNISQHNGMEEGIDQNISGVKIGLKNVD